MTHLWKVEDYLEEIKHLAKLCHSNAGGNLIQNLTKTLRSKLKATKDWTSAAICQLVEVISTTNLPEDCKAHIQQAIESMGQESNHLKTVMAGQTIQCFSPYLSKEDWSKLEESPANTLHTMAIVASRLRSMGLVSLEEQTKIQAMATIFYCLVHKGGKPQPIATTRKSLLKEFASIFHSTPPSDVGGLPMYMGCPCTQQIHMSCMMHLP